MVMKNTDIVIVSPVKYAYNNVWLLFGYQQQKKL